MKSYFLYSWFYSRIWDAGWLQDFIVFFLISIKVMRRRCEFKILLRDHRDGKILSGSSRSCWKIDNLLWKWGVQVYLDRECMEFVIADWILWIYNWNLEQAMRNLTCDDQRILLIVIWLVLSRNETEKNSY